MPGRHTGTFCQVFEIMLTAVCWLSLSHHCTGG